MYANVAHKAGTNRREIREERSFRDRVCLEAD